MVAAGTMGDMKWQVTVSRPGAANPVPADSCFTVPSPRSATSTGSCNDLPALLGQRPRQRRQPVAFTGLSDDGTTETTVGEAAADVTYFIVTFTDGQQLKLIPVTAGGHRYIAWIAPLSMTVASVVAHLGGPYSDSGQTATAVPFDLPGQLPVFGLWQQTGQRGAADGHRGHRRRHGGRPRLEGHRVRGARGAPASSPARTASTACRSARLEHRRRSSASWPVGTRGLRPSASAAPGVATVRVTLVERQGRHGAAGRRRERGPVRVRGRQGRHADPLDRLRRGRPAGRHRPGGVRPGPPRPVRP